MVVRLRPDAGPLTTRAEGEWWAAMDQVFYLE